MTNLELVNLSFAIINDKVTDDADTVDQWIIRHVAGVYSQPFFTMYFCRALLTFNCMAVCSSFTFFDTSLVVMIR